MNKKILLILMLLCIPMVVYATSFSYSDAEAKVNSFGEHYYDSEKYILPKPTGLLTREEYEITRPKGERTAFSYIYDGQPIWISGGYIDAVGNVKDCNNDNGISCNTPKGVKATLYVDSKTNSAGSGTYSNPWIFLQKYNVSLIVDSGHGDLCYDMSCKTGKSTNETQMVIDQGSVTFWVQAHGGFAYLNNTCNGVYNSRGADGIGSIVINNVNRNIVNCKVTFGTGLYALAIFNTNPDTNQVIGEPLMTIYEEYSKGWFTTNDKAQEISIPGLDITTFYNINVRDTTKSNYLGPKPPGWHFGGIRIPKEKLDQTGIDYSTNLTLSDGVITSKELIKSDLTGEIFWLPNEYQISINYCPDGTCKDTDSISIKYDSEPKLNDRLNNKIKNYDGFELLGFYSNKNASSQMVFDKTGKYLINNGSFGNRYRVAGNTTVYAMYTKCPKGQYSSESTSYKCTKCAPGTYSDQPGLKECKKCKRGQVSDEGAERCTGCKAGTEPQITLFSAKCVPCGDGKISDGTECNMCTGATYANNAHTACVACAAGYEANGNHSLCQHCDDGKYRNGNMASCQQCSPGNITTDKHNKCEACPNGKTSNPQQHECIDCEKGQYSNASTAHVCQQCPTGTYGNETGLTECTKCLAGTYTNKTGQISCQQCPKGTYTNKTGQISCQQCPAGTYGNTVGLVECIKCTDNQYTDAPGQTSYKTCSEYQTVKSDHTGCTNNNVEIELHNRLSLLPSGYTQLEYIENSLGDSAYINLGKTYTNNMKFYLKYRPYDGLADPGANYHYNENYEELEPFDNPLVVILGVETTRRIFTVTNTRDSQGWPVNGGVTGFATISGNKTLITGNINYNKNQDLVIRYDGSWYYGNQQISFQQGPTSYNLFLFANNKSGTAIENSHGRVYRLKLLNSSNSLVADYVPCKKSNGDVGLCNVSNTGSSIFISPSPSGSELTGGQEVEEQTFTFNGNKYNEKLVSLNSSIMNSINNYANNYKFTFSGWYDQESGGTQIYDANGNPKDPNKVFDPSMSKHLYARWSKDNNY